jgi:ATP-dependent Clp protease ATP-binding subunit ClpA
MRTITNTPRNRNNGPDEDYDLATSLAARVVGQSSAIDTIVPFVQIYQAGLAPEGRPAGIFLLLGPSGTGKTKTVEALAAEIHGNERNVLRVDCGEFQLEHEVAKLIGAPPGYLGHRETQPLLSVAKLSAVTSEYSSLSIVLFDEIEKAAPSMTRLLLGVLDKGTLRLGDNSSVNFERSLIFMTSNLGAKEMERELCPDFGFKVSEPGAATTSRKLESIGRNAVKRQFTPEFINRIDAIVTYEPLGLDSIDRILDHQLSELQGHVINRMGPRAFRLGITAEARRFLLEAGVSRQFGARELKRTIHKHLLRPLSRLVTQGVICPGGFVSIEVCEDGSTLEMSTSQGECDSLVDELEVQRPVRRVSAVRKPPKAA